MTFQERIASFIASGSLLTPGAKVVVGLSGGADSSALLVVLSRLGYRCIAVHCHFGLRGDEADRDLEHSRALASRCGAEFRSVRFDTRNHMRACGISAEMACRELRYDYFERERRENGAEAIAVGHHREDNVETFFLNLLRGSGIHGLRAMLPKRGYVIRPLLDVTRGEILQYLKSENVSFVEDSTNAQNEFKRNRLRNEVLPLLEAAFPGATDAVARSIACLRSDERLLESLMPPMPPTFRGEESARVRQWLAPYGFNSTQCLRIPDAVAGALFESSSHRLTILPGGGYELDLLDRAEPMPPRLSGRRYPRPENFRFEQGVLYLDADEIGSRSDWELRPWRAGDRMRPFGMKGSKPVSDVLAEAGVSAARRAQTYVLCLGERILWAVGTRTSNYYTIKPTTKEILEIRHETL